MAMWQNQLCVVALIVVTGFDMPCAWAAPQFIQQVHISSSPNPLGSGARALGMGSAFIGFADDATAASWNPAGLIQLETPEVSVVGSFLSRKEDYSSVTNPESAGVQHSGSTDLNYFSVAVPVQLPWTNAVFSLNYQALYDFNKSLNYSFNFSGSEPTMVGIPMLWSDTQQNSARQTGVIHALSPAMAVQVTPYISLGITVNWWTDKLEGGIGWQQDVVAVATGKFGLGALTNPFSTTLIQRESYDHLNGINFNLGLLWEISEMMRLGFVVKTPFNLHMRHHLSIETLGSVVAKNQFDEAAKLHFPLSYGVGLALRFSDAFSLAMDVFRTEWSDFYIQSQGDVPTSPLDGQPLSKSRVKATHQVRVGGEYLFVLPKTVIALRAGLYYDPQPSPDGVDNIYGISVGGGYMYDNIVFDMAYTYDWGNHLNGSASGIANSTFKLRRHRIYASAIVHF
ncbi:MAG: OmpP1/FadL family transporter [Flavobacteriales bacterium]